MSRQRYDSDNQMRLPGLSSCCPHPPARHVLMTASQSAGDTWDFDGCLDCDCQTGERNRHATGRAA